VQVIYYRWDNRYTAEALRAHPDKFMAVCRVNPEDPAAPDHLSYWTEEQGFHGVRLSPAVGAMGEWFTGSLMDPLFRRAADLGVPMLILTRPPRLPDLAVLLERRPDLDVVVDHMADVTLDNAEGIRALLDLARYPRVHVKISHTWSISKQDYPWRDAQELVKRVHQAFGAQRLMWGTDWPMSPQWTTYARTLSVVRDEMRFFTDEEREWVLGKTALKLWPFDRAERDE
jgi:L-fuconolactonase